MRSQTVCRASSGGERRAACIASAALFCLVLTHDASAVYPTPPYGIYPCDPQSLNCQGGSVHDDLQVKGLERSARSTCSIVPGPYGGYCEGAFQGGPCPGSYQWCQSGRPPQLGSISHSQVSSTEIQLDIPYDFPNNYCQVWANPDPATWPIIGTQNTLVHIVNGHETYAVFENGRWKPTIGCTGSLVPFSITVEATCGSQTVSTTYTVASCAPASPAPQNGPSCSNPAFADGPFGGALGPGNVSIGSNGAPAFAETPVSGPLAPVFTYNGNNLSAPTGLSTGWFFTYGETLVQDAPGRLVWTDATGFRRYFTGSDGSGYVASHPGEALGSIALVGSDYVLSRPDGSTRTFVAASGFWKKATDRWGNGAQGNASSTSRATLVDELAGGAPTGRQLALGYSGGQLTSVTDVGSGVTSLGYDGNGRLATICTADQTCPPTPPALPWRTFSYEGTTSWLTSIEDAAGFAIRGYSWNGSGGVASTWIGALTYAGGKERTLFNQVGSTVTVSRYIDGTSTADTVYTVETIAGVNRVTQISGACPECGAENSITTFDPATGRPLTRTDGNGHVARRHYDAFGNLDQLTEAEGTSVARTTTWDYAVPGVDPLPSTWPSTVRDFWKTKTEPSGAKPGSSVEMSRSFDGVGNLVLNETVVGYLSSTDPTATPRSTETTFDTHGHVVSVDGPRSDVADVTVLEYYDASYPVPLRDRLKRRLEPDLTETTFDSYHALGGVTQETRKLRSGASDADVVTESTFDSRGRLLTRTLKATSAAETDVVTTTGYDSRGRASFTQVQPAGGPVTTRTNFTWEDGTDRLLTRTLTTTAGGPGDRIKYGYDDRGNTTSESYGFFNGSTTTVDWAVTRSYDGRCRVKSQTYPADNATTSYNYDCVGNLTQVTDSLHTVANLIYSYDGRNRLKTVTRKATPADDLTTYDYDARDQLTKVTDPNGAETRFAFDDFGGLRQKTTALSGGGYNDVTSYGYDDAGNLTSESDGVRATTRTWDAAGRLLTIASAPGSPALSISFTYDSGCEADATSGHVFGQGRLCSVVDETGTTTYGYDRRGLVTGQGIAVAMSEIRGMGYDLAFAHDAAGREIEVRYPTGDRLQRTLDGAGRVVTLTRIPPSGSPETILSSVSHKPFGPVTGFVTGGGTVESRGYDTRFRRLTQSTVSGGVTRMSLSYGDGTNPATGWDKEGNLLSIRDTTPGAGTTFDRTFSYDPDRHFLVSSTGPFGASWAQQTLSWSYDQNGNRLTETRSGIGTTSYGYGNDGSGHSNGVLTTITPPGASPVSISSLSSGDLYLDEEGIAYSYDSLGRLTWAREPAGYVLGHPNEARFHHDYRNLRVVRASRPRSSRPVGPWSGAHFLHGPGGELLYESRTLSSGASGGTRVYVWLEGEPIAVLGALSEKDPEPMLGFLHDDHLGRPVGMTDASGALVWRPEYEPFGKSLAPRVDLIHGPGFRLPGQWESEESGDLPGGLSGPMGRIGALTDNWHRTYVQRWGRYSQPDPIGLQADLNLFRYANSNPMSFTDATGLQAEAIAVGAAAGCVAVLEAMPPVLAGTIIVGMVAMAGKECIEARRCGSCTPEEHAALQAAVNAACKAGPRRCSPTQDPATLATNMGKNLACAAARDTINQRCFGGGDAGHRQAADQARSAAIRCARLLRGQKAGD